jgi:hypothetical protein
VRLAPSSRCSPSYFVRRRSLAQVPDLAVAGTAPVPGAGHHYIGTGVETVSPADGLLSFNLPVQTPAGRQFPLTASS